MGRLLIKIKRLQNVTNGFFGSYMISVDKQLDKAVISSFHLHSEHCKFVNKPGPFLPPV